MRRLPSRRRARGGLRFRPTRVDAARLAQSMAAFAVRRAPLVILVAGLLVIASILLALRLDSSAATDTLIDRGDRAAVATEEFHRQFGGEPISVLARGRSGTVNCEPECRLPDLLLTADLARIAALEGCLSGNVPRGARPLAPACTELGRRRPIEAVYGPGTFINESVRQVSSRFEAQRRQRAGEAAQAARAARELAKARGLGKAEQDRLARRARQLVYAQFARDALDLALSYGLTTVPSLNNPAFVLRLVFEPSLGAGVPKPRFAYLFPSERSALIQARLRADLGEPERERAIELVKEAVASPAFRLERGEYLVSGPPVVAAGVASGIPGSLLLVLGATLVLTVGALALAFRSRPRLAPLAPAAVATALTLGVMSLAGVALTVVTIAVLPITFALALGYAIHFQARFYEVEGDAPGERAAAAVASGGAPIIAGAGLAAAAAFLAVLLSSVPTVRSFGALIAVGILLSLVSALTVGSAWVGGGIRLGALPRRGARVPAWLRRRRDVHLLRGGGRVLGRLMPARLRMRRLAARTRAAPPARATTRLHGWTRLAAFLEKAKGGAAHRITAAGRGALHVAVRRPRVVLAIAAAVALAGWLVDSRTDVVSSLQRLAPGDLQEVKDARALERETGVSGEVNVVVRAEDVAAPKVVRWMNDYQERVLDRHGYSEERVCRRAELCPGLSVTNLFGSGRVESAKRIRALLEALPPYFSRSVISSDRHAATIAFGVRTMPRDRQSALVEDLRAQLDPPAGVRAELAGSQVLSSDANADLESSGRLMTLAALAFVFVVLLALQRRAERVIALLIPLALASGWSALVVFVLRIPLNPLSAALGALVIAICAQAAVILSARYRLERDAGQPPAAALARAYGRAGGPLLASGAVAIAGLAALIVSDVRMLREFGFVAVVDLTIALLGVMVLLSTMLMWAEQWRPAEAIRGLVRRVRRAAPVGARSARGGR